jgi:hypothetical protein
MGSSKSGRVDQATWDRLVEAYRQDPGNHSAAARLCDVQRRTSKRAYELGYPDRPWGTKPIKQLIMEDIELARSRVQLDAERAELEEDRTLLDSERDREAARQHAVRAKTEEAVLVSGARAAAMRGLAAAIEASPGVKAAMKRLGDELTEMAEAGGPMDLKTRNFLSASCRRYSSMLRELAQAGQTAMQMERLYLGEPTEIVGVKTELDDTPTADLVRMAGYQDEVLRRAAARGVIDLGAPKTNGHNPDRQN